MSATDDAQMPDEQGEPDWDWDLGDDVNEVETDIGEKIEWEKLPKGKDGSPVFYGTFLATSEVDTADPDTGELRPVKVHNFRNLYGNLCFAWHSPRLDRGLAAVPRDAQVKIIWLGKEKLGKTKTMNNFRVLYKPPAK